jgi:hypothetical protein
VRPRPWLITFAVGVALTPAAELASLMLPMDSQWLLAWPALNCVLIVAAALVYLASQVFGRSPAPSRALALALLSLARSSGKPYHWGVRRCPHDEFCGDDPGVAQAVEVLVVGLVLVAFTARDLRRLPPRRRHG